ncbi:MAG TPA: glycosyltransferase family 39 protein, partial [Devosia sp.]|nr:glycosyltransferase family 39 protein [Devosia sp.]
MNDRTIELGSIALRLVQLLAVALVVFHLVHLFFASVFMDEAYYWIWGQHPALSYYDHPPLNAWLLGLSSALFGWNLLALRVPVVLSFLADIYAIFLLSRAIAGDAWRTHFWVTLLLFVGSPIYWMVSGYALPDHLLLTGCLYAL